MDSSHKSDEKTSEEKSDLENIMKTSKQTDSVETVKPFAQGAMPTPVQVIGTMYPNIPLSSANHCNVFLPYRITPKVP